VRMRHDMRKFCASLPQRFTYSMLASVMHRDGIVKGKPARVLRHAKRCGWLLRDAEEAAFHAHPAGGGPRRIELQVWVR